MEDPRRTIKGNFKYPMMEILFLCFTTSVCGLTDWEDMVLFAEERKQWYRRFLPYKHGFPSQDTVRRLLNALDPKAFSKYFTEWAQQLYKITDGQSVAIDGKAVRSYNKQHPKDEGMVILSAFCNDLSLCLGQVDVAKKSNEITAIPQLLDMLFLRNAVVTIDAMGCQREVAEKIRAGKQANYVLAVKGNQATLKEEIEDAFRFQKSSNSYTSKDKNGSYITERTCEVISDLESMEQKEKWLDLASIIRLTSRRTHCQTDEQTTEVRYYISSLQNTDSKEFGTIIRTHWGIENKLHWSLDVLWKEDQTAKRNANGIKNQNIINKMALHFIDRLKEQWPRQKRLMSKPKKMRLALLNTTFLEKVLGWALQSIINECAG